MKDAAKRTLRQRDLYLWYPGRAGRWVFLYSFAAGTAVFTCAVKVCNGSMKVHVVKYKI